MRFVFLPKIFLESHEASHRLSASPPLDQDESVTWNVRDQHMTATLLRLVQFEVCVCVCLSLYVFEFSVSVCKCGRVISTFSQKSLNAYRKQLKVVVWAHNSVRAER